MDPEKEENISEISEREIMFVGKDTISCGSGYSIPRHHTDYGNIGGDHLDGEEIIGMELGDMSQNMNGEEERMGMSQGDMLPHRRIPLDIPPLHRAAWDGDLAEARTLLIAGKDCNQVDRHGWTPLHYAAYKGHPDVVSLLLQDDRILPDKKCNSQRTPLHIAAREGHLGVTRKLVEHKRFRSRRFGAFKGLQLGVRLAGTINICDGDGRTAQHYAAYHGNAEVFKFLVSHRDSQPDPTDNNGNTPMLSAVQGNQRHFLVGMQDTEEEKKHVMLHYFAGIGQLEELDNLMESDDIDPTIVLQGLGSPMDVALHFGRTRVEKYLLDKQAVSFKKGNRLLTSVFHQSSDKLKNVRKYQMLFWLANIQLMVEDIQALPANIGIEEYRELGKMDEHYDLLKTWHANLCKLKFEDMMKVPEFIAVELDASVKYRHVAMSTHGFNIDSDEGRADCYYQTFYQKLTKPAYQVCYDLLQPDIHGDVPEDHPLEIIVNEDCQILMDHPVVRHFVRGLWTKAAAFILPFFIIYLTFASVLSVFMKNIPVARYNVTNTVINVTDTEDNVTDTVEVQGNGTKYFCPENSPNHIGYTAFLITISVFGLLFEIIQMKNTRGNYFKPTWDEGIFHNLCTWVSFVGCLAITISICIQGCIVIGNWEWTLGVIVLLITWFTFISQLRYIPYFGIYVVMVEIVLESFFKFCCVLILYLLAFAMCFHILLPSSFGHFGTSIITVWVMMMGEMGYTDLPSSDDGQMLGESRWLFHALFVVFLITLSLILMNLLTGIVITDVATINTESQYRILKMQIKQSLGVERLKWYIRKFFSKTCRSCRRCGFGKDDNCYYEKAIPRFPPIERSVTIIEDEPQSLLAYVCDYLFFGPLNIEYCMTEFSKIREATKQHWHVLPNCEWRNARSYNSATDFMEQNFTDIAELISLESQETSRYLTLMRDEFDNQISVLKKHIESLQDEIRKKQV